VGGCTLPGGDGSATFVCNPWPVAQDSPPAAAFAQEYARAHHGVLDRLDWDAVAALIGELVAVRRRGGTVYTVGNGGSASTASHFVVDFMKGAGLAGNPPLRTVCLADCVPALTAIANDLSYDEVFAAQLHVMASPGDALLVVTGSGRSPNVLRAIEAARDVPVPVLGMLGMGGGPAAEVCDVSVVVDSEDYGVIEDVHLFLGHLATAYLRATP